MRSENMKKYIVQINSLLLVLGLGCDPTVAMMTDLSAPHIRASVHIACFTIEAVTSPDRQTAQSFTGPGTSAQLKAEAEIAKQKAVWPPRIKRGWYSLKRTAEWVKRSNTVIEK